MSNVTVLVFSSRKTVPSRTLAYRLGLPLVLASRYFVTGQLVIVEEKYYEKDKEGLSVELNLIINAASLPEKMRALLHKSSSDALRRVISLYPNTGVAVMPTR